MRFPSDELRERTGTLDFFVEEEYGAFSVKRKTRLLIFKKSVKKSS